MQARSFRFMFIDMTQGPMGPGLPFIVSGKAVEEACKMVDGMYRDPRRMRVYQVPDFDGMLNFLIMYNTGDPLPTDFIKDWYNRNVVEHVQRERKARG